MLRAGRLWGLRETGGARVIGQEDSKGTVMWNDRKCQPKTARFRNLGEIPVVYT